jgi:hypothetical protein
MASYRRPGPAHLDLALVLSAHSLDVHFKVEFAHAFDDRLVGLGVHVGLEVGSSLVKRFRALPIWSEDFLSLGSMAREMTGSG